MERSTRTIQFSGTAAAVLLVLLLQPAGFAQQRRFVSDVPPRPYRGAGMEEFRRAGWPQHVRRWAHPTDNGHYGGYYVGGGAAWHGHDRFPHEGTWGWDYLRLVFYKRVALGWWHGRRHQGGTGAYATDGPRLLHHHR